MTSRPETEVSPLRVARHLRGLSAKELADAVGKTGSWISQLERGSKELTEEVARAFAAALRVPPAFLLQGPLQSSAGVLHFRHKRRTPAAQKHRVHARALLVRMLVHELEHEFDGLFRPRLPTIELPGQPGDPGRLQRIDKAAQRLRREWDMGDGPIPDLIRLVEVHGIWVVDLPPEDRTVDAFSWWGDGHAFIALNPVPLAGHVALASEGPRNAYRERFSVAHELGHILLHADLDEDCVGARDVEKEAHRFAASFLVPPAQWRAMSPGTTDWRDYRQLAGRWGVSTSVLLRRNYDMGVYGHPNYKSAMIRMSAEIGRKDEGRHLPPRVHESPGRLRAHLQVLETQAGITIEDLAQRLAISEDDLWAIVAVQPPAGRGDLGKVIRFPSAGGVRQEDT